MKIFWAWVNLRPYFSHLTLEVSKFQLDSGFQDSFLLHSICTWISCLRLLPIWPPSAWLALKGLCFWCKCLVYKCITFWSFQLLSGAFLSSQPILLPFPAFSTCCFPSQESPFSGLSSRRQARLIPAAKMKQLRSFYRACLSNLGMVEIAHSVQNTSKFGWRRWIN